MQTPLCSRSLSRGLSASPSWICTSCARSIAPRTRLTGRNATARFMSSPSGPRHQGYRVPTMEQANAVYRRKNKTLVNYTLSIILGTVALSYGSVPMYKMICQQTGWGGQPIKAHNPSDGEKGGDYTKRITPLTNARRIRVTFASSVSDVLPWKFVPQQREVRVLPGETALAFYTATNTSDEDIIGIATYSVVPAQVAGYFSKIQCFCFEEQRLSAGETVDMPVFFYIDPDVVNDFNTKDVLTVTLNYTFFKARYDKEGHLKPVPMG